ncbi:MAG TPA: YecA family protein [Moraxellaceae bacterium]|nr:YecA family protein [Moraxellaceae bacterium]
MHENHALPAETRQRLMDFLDSDENPEGLDFVATHGFLSALTVGPDTPATADWIRELFDGQPVCADATRAAQITADLEAWRKEIHATLYHGQSLRLPCPLTLKATESTELNDWCAGFMEGMFMKEASWYDADEDLVADLTLPMVVLSDLIDDPELQHLRRDQKLVRDLAQQIPDVLTELYLHFHAPRTA